MFSPTRMQRMTILALRGDLHLLIQVLISTELFQPIDPPLVSEVEEEMISIQPMELFKAYAQVERDLRVLFQRFRLPRPELAFGPSDPNNDLVPIQKMVADLKNEFVSVDQLHEELKQKMKSLEQSQIARRALAQWSLSEHQLRTLERVVVRLGWVPLKVIPYLRERTKTFFSILAPIVNWENRVLLLTVALPQESERLSGVLVSQGFQEGISPKGSLEDKTTEISMDHIQAQLIGVDKRLKELRQTWQDPLVEAMIQVGRNFLILQSEEFARALGPLVVIQGWVPEPEAKSFTQQILAGGQGRVWLKAEPAEEVAYYWEKRASLCLFSTEILFCCSRSNVWSQSTESQFMGRLIRLPFSP